MPTIETLSASEQAGLAADAPILAGANALELTESEGWSSNGTFASVRDSLAPIRNAYDYQGSPTTGPFPDGTWTPTTWYLLFQLPVNTRPVDLVVLKGLNMPDIVGAVGNVQVRVETADNSAFSSGRTTVALTTYTAAAPGNGTMVGIPDVRYRGQRWWRVLFIGSGAWPTSTSLVPRVGEVWLARRRQLHTQPQRPLDWDATDGVDEVTVAAGGRMVGAVDFAGRGVWDLRFRTRVDDYGNHGADPIRGWWRDCRHGGPGLLIPRPSSDPTRAHIVRPGARGLSIQQTGPVMSECSLRLLEQPPFWASSYEVGA